MDGLCIADDIKKANTLPPPQDEYAPVDRASRKTRGKAARKLGEEVANISIQIRSPMKKKMRSEQRIAGQKDGDDGHDEQEDLILTTIQVGKPGKKDVEFTSTFTPKDQMQVRDNDKDDIHVDEPPSSPALFTLEDDNREDAEEARRTMERE